ncbi:DMT family transporter [Alkalicoccus halolimnae]|uniref:DMT family transporter n=1 Tax=Alkalicoccus halolimnae TaxID=1667239 RepID=A0A5C7FAP3_9BACI|nr:DMT family transporter [Alkalicoccus halolimnae]TXF86600.1 DMT family transporter [Alkalicoccus halolimnae]
MSLHPYFLITLAMLFFSGNFIAGKAFEGIIDPITLAFFRAFLGSIVLIPLCFKEIVRNMPLWKREWKALTSLSLSGIVLFNVSLYAAVNYTSTINASIVDALTPAVAAVLGYILLKERLHIMQNFGVLFSFLGVLWIITEGRPALLLQLSVNIGDVIMFAGVCCWAVYSIVIKRHSYKFPPVAGLTVTMIIGWLMLLPFTLAEVFLIGFPALTSSSVAGGLLYIGIFPSAIALLLWYKGVGEVGPSKASVFFNLVPLFTTLMAVIFLGENFTVHQFSGGAAVLIGVYFAAGRKY